MNNDQERLKAKIPEQIQDNDILMLNGDDIPENYKNAKEISLIENLMNYSL